MPSRDKILKTIKSAITVPSQLPELPEDTDNTISRELDAITPKSPEALRDQFAKELAAIDGEFEIVKNQQQMYEHIRQDMEKNQYQCLVVQNKDLHPDIDKSLSGLECIFPANFGEEERKNRLAVTQAGLVSVDYAVADVASLAVIMRSGNSLFPHYLPDTIYVTVKAQQLLPNLYTLFDTIPAEQAKNMLLISGPSRTADIEKILILGAHGPRRLKVFWFES